MIEYIVLLNVHLYKNEYTTSFIHIHLLLQYSALKILLLLILHLFSLNCKQRFFVAN